MNVKELKALLKGVADNVPVMQPGSDHGYCPTSGCIETAVQENPGEPWYEDNGELLKGAIRRPIVLIR